jgi:hypothetical protein
MYGISDSGSRHSTLGLKLLVGMKYVAHLAQFQVGRQLAFSQNRAECNEDRAWTQSGGQNVVQRRFDSFLTLLTERYQIDQAIIVSQPKGNYVVYIEALVAATLSAKASAFQCVGA